MQGTNNNDDVIEIDLQEVVGLLIHWLWLIVACGIVTGLIGFLVSYFVITPMYKSTTKIYILDRQSSNNSLTYSDVQLGSILTKDYAQLIKDRTVLESVLETFGMSESYGSLQSRVSVEALSDTRIINITVEDANPQMAQLLADEIRKVAAEHIEDVTAIEAVNVVEEANLPVSPSSPSVMKWTGIGGLIGVFICAMIVVIQFLVDDTVKTSDDVEKYLGLSTLALIPLFEDAAMKEKKEKKRKKSQKSSSSSSHSEGQKKPESSSSSYKDVSDDNDDGDLEEVF